MLMMPSVKNVTSYSKSFYCFFESYLVCVPSYQLINSGPLSRKKCECDGDNFTPTPHKRLRGQNMPVEIRLIELTEPSDT